MRILIVNAGVQSKLKRYRKKLFKLKPWLSSLVLPTLAGLIPKGHEIVLWDEQTQGPIDEHLIEQFHLVLLTGLTTSHYRMVEIAKMAKACRTMLVAGGRDVIGWYREFGDVTRLLRWFPSVCTSLCDEALMGEIIANAECRRLLPHYTLPIGYEYKFCIPRYDLLRLKDAFVAGVQSSAGCIFDCNWCSVSGQGHFHKDPGLFYEELCYLRGLGVTFVTDMADNFIGKIRYLPGKLEAFKKSGLKWGTETTVTELNGGKAGTPPIEQMIDAGCCLLYIGVEGLIDDDGNLISRHPKCTTEKLRHVLEVCRKRKVAVIGSFILDCDRNETPEVMLSTARQASPQFDFLQFSDAAALPGTRLRKEEIELGGPVDDNLEHQDGAHATIIHDVSKAERERILAECYAISAQPQYVYERLQRARWEFKLPILAASARFWLGRPRA